MSAACAEWREFGRLLRQARFMAGMSQQQAASAVGVHSTYLSKIETGNIAPPSVGTLLRLCALFRVDPLPLLQARHPPPPELASLSTEQWLALWEWLRR